MKYFIFALLLNLTFTNSALSDNYSDTKNKPLTPVRVQLKWFHQFQFAGFYAAIEEGYFREAGLEVTLVEGGPKINPSIEVQQGKTEFGIGNSSLLIDFNQGGAIKVVSAIFQHSPFIILARRSAEIKTVKDLEGRRVMGEPHAAELIAYLKLSGVELDNVDLIEHTGTIASIRDGDPSRIVASTAYISTEPYDATKLNIPFTIFNPRELGIDFYGDTLFTTEEYATNNPEIVSAMKSALSRGWKFAANHPDEVISLILRKYPTKRDRLSLHFEAQALINLLSIDILDVGYMSYSRWKHIGETFVKSGLLESDFSLDGFLFETEKQLPSWLVPVGIAFLILLSVGFYITFYIVKLNRKLMHQSKQLAQANDELSRLSLTDALTGLANRRMFDETLANELSRAQRSSQSLALLMIDVDHFKEYNDYYGHVAGDNCLFQIAQVLKKFIRRNGDLVARYGGEEFAVILVNTDKEACVKLAEHLINDVQELNLIHAKSDFQHVTVSIGVFASVPEANSCNEEFIKRADQALYNAKHNGRNRVGYSS